MKRVLIIGAGGFIGGFIAEESLRRGYDTWCGVRPSTSRRFLSDPRLHFVELDYDSPSAMARQLRGALPEGEKWDWIVYNLGATKVMVYSDFNRINYQYLRHTIEALETAAMMPALSRHPLRHLEDKGRDRIGDHPRARLDNIPPDGGIRPTRAGLPDDGEMYRPPLGLRNWIPQATADIHLC